MAWPKPSTGSCALCGKKTAMVLWGAKYGMRICVRCQKVSSAMANLMILASVTPGNHNFDTDDTIMALAMEDLIPRDKVLDKVSGRPVMGEGCRMSRVVECEICHRRILDNGKPWNLKGWTAVTAIGADCALSEFHVCPDHPTWTVSGSPCSQEVRRCVRTTGAPPSWPPSWW